MTRPPGIRARDGAWRRARLADARLYVCADARAAQDDLAAFLDAVLYGGADLIQLRDKEADEADLRASAAVYRRAAERHGALFVLNDDPELAADVGADGVHVGQDDATPELARGAVGPEALVGRSTHDADQIDAALGEDCDYFAVGPVHATPTKEGRPPVGLEPVRYAARIADRPWFVTGGMAAATLPDALRAGARRAVVVRALTESADPAGAATDLARLLRSAAIAGA